MKIGAPAHARGNAVSGVGKSCRGTLHLNFLLSTHPCTSAPRTRKYSPVDQSINRINRFAGVPRRIRQLSSRALHPNAIPASFAFSTRPSPPINTFASPARSFSRAVPRTEPPSSGMAIPAFDAVPITALPTGASPHFIPASTGLPQQIQLTKWNRSHRESGPISSRVTASIYLSISI